MAERQLGRSKSAIDVGSGLIEMARIAAEAGNITEAQRLYSVAQQTLRGPDVETIRMIGRSWARKDHSQAPLQWALAKPTLSERTWR